jgi:hypothetical protein
LMRPRIPSFDEQVFLGLLFGWKNFLTTSCCCCFCFYTWMCIFKKKKHWTRWQGKYYIDDKERRNQKANHQMLLGLLHIILLLNSAGVFQSFFFL